MRRHDGLNKDMLERYAPRPGARALLPELDERALLALTCRMLVREGWDDHIAGHLTLRLPDESILANPWELRWDELRASDILRLDPRGQVIEGDWNITPAIGLHLQLHALRPDINVVAHNHGRWSGIWANLQRVPPVYDQTSAHCGSELPLVNEYRGTFDDEQNSLEAVLSLGTARWALLANHGALVVGENMRQLHLRVCTLEWRSRRAYEVELAGGGVALSEQEIERVAISDANGFPFLFEAMARRELDRDPSVLD